MHWLTFVSAALCCLAVRRSRPALCAFAAAYALSLLVPHRIEDPLWWRTTWPWITGALLTLRVCMVVESSRELLASLSERRWALAGALSASAAVILILLPFRPLALDYWSFVAVRQYLQVAMACLMLFLVLYAALRPIRSGRLHAMILLIVLIDYAVASSFDAHTGLASGFFLVTMERWQAVSAISRGVLALCFLAWAAAAHRSAEAVARENREQETENSPRTRHGLRSVGIGRAIGRL